MLGGFAALAGLALLAKPARSADHQDAPATKADPASDINDVYTFVDGSNFVTAMTVTPFAGAGAKFATSTQYAFHVGSGAAFGTTTANVDIVCTFDATQKIACWVGSADYVTGDASSRTAPLTSASGKVKVFAGAVSDAFFFNLHGFKDTVAAVEQAAPNLAFDDAGCPTIDGNTSATLLGLLKEPSAVGVDAGPDGGDPDDFTNANTLAIVVSVDKTLINKGGAVASVWASTNKGQ